MNKSNGNMYGFVTHTRNPIKGNCQHNCSYCYMKKWGDLGVVRVDEKELNKDLGSDKFVFVGSGTDMFADDVKTIDIQRVIGYMNIFDNKYLLQTKNTKRLLDFVDLYTEKNILCTTIETNRTGYEFETNHNPVERALYMKELKEKGFKTMITIEPIIDFDLEEFTELIKLASPLFIAIGADSKGSGLEEPSREKVFGLIKNIESLGIKYYLKDNITRILNSKIK